ncbi:MAG: hypothetical protein HY306_13630 [Nitrosomonadales bacterium]|nr:hypothetical protein [Nitrosomonadales bacterium]
MQTEASRSLKWLYCLTLLAAVFPTGMFGATSWGGLAAGGGILSGGVFALAILLAIFIYRIVLVARNPHTLNAYITSTRVKYLRRLGIFLMVAALIGSFAIFFIRPLTLGIFSKPGENGIAFFVTGVFIYLISSMGLPGLLIFEASRLFGFEAQIEAKPIQRTVSSITIKRPGVAHDEP